MASRRRRVTGFTVTAVGLPLLTAALMPFRGGLAEGSLLLVYLLAVVGVAVLGGLVPALTAAAGSFLLVNWFLTPPYYTLTVASSDAAVDLVVFVLVAVVVSVTVDLGARHRRPPNATASSLGWSRSWGRRRSAGSHWPRCSSVYGCSST